MRRAKARRIFFQLRWQFLEAVGNPLGIALETWTPPNSVEVTRPTPKLDLAHRTIFSSLLLTTHYARLTALFS